MSQQTFGVLLVSGKYTHQENYSRSFEADPRCRLVALTDERDVDEERAALNRAWAEELGVPYVPDLEDALALDGVDLVSVCPEPERRGRVLARCARAGKHLYIDKPMTPFLAAARDVVQAVEEAGVRTQMMSQIFMPHAQRAKQIVASGELGELRAIHADCLFAKGPAGTAKLGQPRKQPYPPPGFTFVDSKAELYAMGVYAVGLVRWLSGQEVETVYARTANYFFREHQRNGVEDFGFIAMTLDGGLTATITVRRIVANEGVERILPLHSPKIAKIEVKRHGHTRRARLYYLRQRVGKKRRLRDRRRGLGHALVVTGIKQKATETNDASPDTAEADEAVE